MRCNPSSREIDVTPRFPPLAVTMSFGIAMWIVAGALPSLRCEFLGRRPIALGLFALGVAISLAGVIAFRSLLGTPAQAHACPPLSVWTFPASSQRSTSSQRYLIVRPPGVPPI
mgnify:CR=1 FL=1